MHMVQTQHSFLLRPFAPLNMKYYTTATASPPTERIPTAAASASDVSKTNSLQCEIYTGEHFSLSVMLETAKQA